MSSKKKSSEKNKKIEESEEENEMDLENEEEIEDQGEEFEEQEEEEEEKEPKEGNEEENEEIKEKEDIDQRIANIGDENLKIQNIISILSDFKNRREEGKSRNDYMNELKYLCQSYFEYNSDICDLIFNLFSPNEAVKFMEASDSQKVLTIRANSLKTKRRELAKNLISRGVNLDPLAEWSKVGLKIYSSTVPIGATPEYLSGQYMLQSPSSFLPVLALNPLPGEKILDMCASPGGKTTYIGQLMKNEGLLVANDLKKERIKSLFFNIHRLGIKNSIITNYDGREFAKLYNKFDRVLLDAPCSGLGVISKDKSVKMNRTYKEILNNSRLQKELILAAIDSCNAKGKGEGIIVYSTCTISVEENEWVIDYALKHRYVKCIETGLEIGEPGFVQFREKHFHPSIANTRRIYPHIHEIDGFFIAKLKKYSDGPKLKGDGEKKEEKKNKKEKKDKKKKKEIEYDNEIMEEEEESEPEDIQEQIKKGKLKNYNIGEDKKKKNKKNKKEEDEDDDDGIFSGEEYEKDEEDVEKEAKIKEKNKKEKNKLKQKEKTKKEKKEKNKKFEEKEEKEEIDIKEEEDLEKEKENEKEKSNKKKKKKEKKEKENIIEDNENDKEENMDKKEKFINKKRAKEYMNEKNKKSKKK
jgi:ribosomal RNA methyltransferase Nop2